jgi:SAM-dependent methyltransferase
LLALVADGFDVEGLDASADMLERCRARARELGLAVTLHHQEMQSLDLPKRYRAIFVAEPSFMVIDDLGDAKRALARIREHLEPGGHVAIPLFLPPATRQSKHATGAWSARKPVQTEDGRTIRLTERYEYDDAAQLMKADLRYELFAGDELVDSTERPWRLRWYDQDQFRALLVDAGFAAIEAVRGDFTPSRPSDAAFVFLARRE